MRASLLTWLTFELLLAMANASVTCILREEERLAFGLNRAKAEPGANRTSP
jgi:hypothetical protein